MVKRWWIIIGIRIKEELWVGREVNSFIWDF